MTALIRLENVSKAYGGVQAVDGVSLEIRAGEFFALLGPSGCGKTTLLRLIAGLETPDSGRVIIDGADVTQTPPWRRPVNTVFQSYALFPHMTVAGNIAFGLKQDGLARAAIDERVEDMLDLVQLGGLGGRKPDQLSGGQRQRVALARSLAKQPKALLLDEPLAALDRKLRERMQTELCAIQRRLGLAFVFVTHDQDEAMSMAHRLVVMRNGRIEQEGAPRDVYERPASRYVADFLGRANLVGGRVLGRVDSFIRIATEIEGLVLRAPCAEELAPQTEVWVSIRPENVILDKAGQPNLPEGVVREASYAGDYSRYEVELAGGMILRATMSHRAGATGATHPGRGDRVRVSWPAEAGVLLTR